MTDKNRVCVFAHYDRDDLIDEYIYYYLHELLTVVQKLVFVTVSDIDIDAIKRLKNLNIDVIKRENIGYDFYSYKVGIESLDLEEYDELLICNDSVYGPFFSIKNIFNEMKNIECDFWGMTDSGMYVYHLQSYFIVFRSNVFQSVTFQKFWDELSIIDDKAKLINAYELGLSQVLISANFKSKVYINYQPTIQEIKLHIYKYFAPSFPGLRHFKMFITGYYWKVRREKNYNITVAFWDKIILKSNMPFIKKSVLTTVEDYEDNIREYKSIIASKSTYPIELISKNILRMLSK